jgi:hypothetical protein
MSKSIKKILENNGFSIIKNNQGFELQQYTPTGEDWWISLTKLSDIKDYAENFDEEEEFEFWVKADIRGKPSVSEL